MRRVVVTGSECTGKTTLAEALAHHYRAVQVPEYARLFVADKGAPVEAEDVGAIARGQVALEEEMAGAAGTDWTHDAPIHGRPSHDLPAQDLLILDTDLLSTIVYSRHYYGACPEWIEATFRQRRADLYLLAGIDVPWVPDGDQRDRGDRREEMQGLFRQALADRLCRSLEIQGPLTTRLEIAIEAIDQLSR